MKRFSFWQRLIAMTLSVCMVFSISATALAAGRNQTTTSYEIGTETYDSPTSDYSATKISVDGLLLETDGTTDAGQGYTWSAVGYEEYVYIGSSYGQLLAMISLATYSLGLSEEASIALMDTLWNGELFTDTDYSLYTPAGAIILKVNTETGEATLVYDDVNDSIAGYRTATEFNGKLYFISSPTSGAAEMIEVDPTTDDAKVVYTAPTTSGTTAGGIKALAVYGDEMIFSQYTDAGMNLVSTTDVVNFEVIADQEDLLDYPVYNFSDNLYGGGIYDMIAYNGKLYFTVVTEQSFALFEGTKDASGDWNFAVIVGDGADGAAYPYGLNSNDMSLAANLAVYDGYLYLGGYNDPGGTLTTTFATMEFETLYNLFSNPVSMWRMDANGTITTVAGEYSDLLGAAEGNLGAGYGTAFSQYTWDMQEYDGNFYMTTFDFSTIATPITTLTTGDILEWTAEDYESQLAYIEALLALLLAEDETVVEEDTVEEDTVEENTQSGKRSAEILASENPKEEISSVMDSKKSSRAVADPTPFDTFNVDYNDYDALEEVAYELVDIYEEVETMQVLADQEGGVEVILEGEQVDVASTIYDAMLAVQEALATLDTNLPEDAAEFFEEYFSAEDIENYAYFVKVLEFFFDAEPGFDMFVSEDGVNFQTITTDGLGDDTNHGGRNLVVTTSGLVIGTANGFTGSEVWLLEGDSVDDESVAPELDDVTTVDGLTIAGKFIYANGNEIVLEDSVIAGETVIYVNGTQFTGEIAGDSDGNYDLSAYSILGGSATDHDVTETNIIVNGGNVAAIYAGGSEVFDFDAVALTEELTALTEALVVDLAGVLSVEEATAFAEEAATLLQSSVEDAATDYAEGLAANIEEAYNNAITATLVDAILILMEIDVSYDDIVDTLSEDALEQFMTDLDALNEAYTAYTEASGFGLLTAGWALTSAAYNVVNNNSELVNLLFPELAELGEMNLVELVAAIANDEIDFDLITEDVTELIDLISAIYEMMELVNDFTDGLDESADLEEIMTSVYNLYTALTTILEESGIDEKLEDIVLALLENLAEEFSAEFWLAQAEDLQDTVVDTTTDYVETLMASLETLMLDAQGDAEVLVAAYKEAVLAAVQAAIDDSYGFVEKATITVTGGTIGTIYASGYGEGVLMDGAVVDITITGGTVGAVERNAVSEAEFADAMPSLTAPLQDILDLFVGSNDELVYAIDQMIAALSYGAEDPEIAEAIEELEAIKATIEDVDAALAEAEEIYAEAMLALYDTQIVNLVIEPKANVTASEIPAYNLDGARVYPVYFSEVSFTSWNIVGDHLMNFGDYKYRATVYEDGTSTVERYYIIAVDADNGEEVYKVETYDGKIELPADPTRESYVFDGWYMLVDGAQVAVTSSTVYTSDATVYAAWKAETYTITYAGPDGMSYKNPSTYTVESPTIILSDARLEGYTFDGWFTLVEGRYVKVTTIPTGSAGDIILTARFTAIPVVEEVEEDEDDDDTATTTSAYSFHLINVSTVGSGTVTPETDQYGAYALVDGEMVTFAFAPDAGYAVTAVYVDGVDVGAVSYFTFNDLTQDHTLCVVFGTDAAGHTNPQTGVDVG